MPNFVIRALPKLTIGQLYDKWITGGWCRYSDFETFLRRELGDSDATDSDERIKNENTH